jgi:hypothetical protein
MMAISWSASHRRALLHIHQYSQHWQGSTSSALSHPQSNTPFPTRLQFMFHPQRGKTHLIKFLLRIRGALTAAPTRELPVSQIPQAAPTTEKPNPKAIPKLAHPYGDKWERSSDHPALQYGELQRSEDMFVSWVFDQSEGVFVP